MWVIDGPAGGYAVLEKFEIDAFVFHAFDLDGDGIDEIILSIREDGHEETVVLLSEG